VAVPHDQPFRFYLVPYQGDPQAIPRSISLSAGGFPLASGFLIWIAGLDCFKLAYHKAKQLFHQSRYVSGDMCPVAVAAIWWSLRVPTMTQQANFTTPFTRLTPEQPDGRCERITPVVWIHDANAASWDGLGSW
jgi:hypothetical protein